jgi:hypothetical protein
VLYGTVIRRPIAAWNPDSMTKPAKPTTAIAIPIGMPVKISTIMAMSPRKPT